MENVTEELVRQNGNQAAAVMADYAGQGGGGGESSQGISVFEAVSAPVFRSATVEDLAKFSKSGSSVIRVAEINGVVPLTIVSVGDGDVVVMHLYGLGFMGEDSSTTPFKALYKVSRPNTSNPSIKSVVYHISDDGSLLGEEGLM